MSSPTRGNGGGGNVGDKRRPTSWSDYGASIARSSSEGVGKNKRPKSALKSSSRRHSNGSSGSGRSKPVPKGIDALYVDAPPGIDTRLQFQWMRPHPSSAILAAAAAAAKAGAKGRDCNDDDVIVAAAKIIGQCRRADQLRASATTKESNERFSNNEVCHADSTLTAAAKRATGFRATPPTVSVDLISLFDPPLLSEWTPGLDINISYDSESESGKEEEQEWYGFSTSAGGAKPGEEVNVEKVKGILAEVLKLAAGQAAPVTSEIGVASETSKIGDKIQTMFGKLSTDSLVEHLPSRLLLQQIISDAKEDRSQLSLSIVALSVLAEFCNTEAMGRHIVSVLAPVLFSSKQVTAEYTATCSTQSNCNEARYYLQKLADILIERCDLGQLSKGELRMLTDGEFVGTDDETSQQIAEDFIMSLGNAYHSKRR